MNNRSEATYAPYKKIKKGLESTVCNSKRYANKISKFHQQKSLMHM